MLHLESRVGPVEAADDGVARADALLAMDREGDLAALPSVFFFFVLDDAVVRGADERAVVVAVGEDQDLVLAVVFVVIEVEKMPSSRISRLRNW